MNVKKAEKDDVGDQDPAETAARSASLSRINGPKLRDAACSQGQDHVTRLRSRDGGVTASAKEGA